jgi:vitamin B12 transporter
MINGVEMNDPISPTRAFDFSHLTPENIERIEVLRGPQSTLYGSDALGGVINIITREGSKAFKGSVSTEYGSFDTLSENVSVSGQKGPLSYSFAAGHLSTRGISSADSDLGNDERDGYENSTFSTRLGYALSSNLALDLVLRYTEANIDIDNGGGAGADDINNTVDTDRLYGRAQATLELLDGLWEQKLSVSHTDIERVNDNDTDPAHPSNSLFSTFEGELLKFDWQHNFYLAENNTLTVGLETEEEKGESFSSSTSAFGTFVSEFGPESVRTNSLYVQDQWDPVENLFLTAGVRTDDHEDFGSETTYRLAAAYLVEETGTKLRATFGTGFKAPSLYQLHAASSFVTGNPNLDPEESEGWDLGIEQTLLDDRVKLSVTYFDNDIEDLIQFDSATSTYLNVAEAETDGIETRLSAELLEGLETWVSYTYQHTRDKTTGLELLRRPEDKYQFGVTCVPTESTELEVVARHVGDRADSTFVGFMPTRVELDSYTVVDVAASHELPGGLKLFGRIENLTDRDYQEVAGYGTPGIGFYGGLKLNF